MGNCEKGCFFSFVALFLEVFFSFWLKILGSFFLLPGEEMKRF